MRGRLSRSSGLVLILASMLLLNMVQGPSLVSTPITGNEDAPVYKQETRKTAYTSHDPFVIDSDSNFSATAAQEVWLGDGSAGDPYIIEGLEIDRAGVALDCISISNTRVNFTIRDCNITGASFPRSGINLDNVTYGRIEQNIVHNNHFNIYLANAHYVVVKNNTCWDSVYSISMRVSSSNNIITDNDSSNNDDRGVNLESGSHHNTVINNTCVDNRFGVVLYLVSDNTIKNNNFSNNDDHGIHNNNADYNFMINNTCNVNDYGIYLFSTSEYNELSNNTCNNNRNFGIYIVTSSYNDLINNTCNSNLYHGIEIVNSAQSDVYNNTCNGNSNYGVYLLVSHQGEFYDNVCNFNSYGIYLTNSQQNNISNNTYANNGIFGIYLIGTSLNNIVEWNVFTENTNSGLDSASPTNTFDYNFWSDYNGIDADQNAIGDTPYQVWGSAGNRDLHPLMLLPNQEIGWIDPPSDQVYEYGEPVIYDVDASAFSGIDYWTVNDTTNFSIDSFGGITNSTILSIGTYGLDISVYDNKGNFLSEIFTVTVASITPTWIEEPTDQLVIYPKAFRYDLNATDYDGLDMWWINDTINFVIDQTGLIVNATILEIKEYGIEVFVNDTLGNILASTFRVTVVKYTEHDPIVIVGDNEFSDIAALEGWQGDGTSQSPFIIELLSIDRNDNAGHCVSISNTLVNFTIKECLLVGASVNPGAGIYLNNVSHGNIIENTFDNNFFNIYLWSSHYVSIINNTCPNSEYSISLLQISSYNNITNNNCSYNNDRGINLASGSHRNVVADNTCNFNTYGIVLHGAHTNTIVGNTLNNNSQDGIHNNDADGNLMVNNTCNGNIYGIYIHSRNIYNKVINNTCNENSRGIYLYFEAFHVDIINNICYKNDDAGIYLQEDASGCVLTNNSCTFNGYGVYFVSFSMDNVITWNVFANNSIENGWDSGLNNVFDYNYWSDYDGVDANGDRIGDTPYTVPGSLGSQDLHPLMKPPGALSWIGILSNQIIELGESFQYELNATSSDDLDIWWLNDTTYFNIDQLGVITNITILDLGTFPLQVFVNDTSGDTISVIFSVFVVDSPPIWSEMPTNQYIRFGDSFYYELSATDSIGIDSWWINDTINFNIDQTGVITNATIFPLGVFILQVNVTDTGGNTISAVFTVSISFYMPHDAILIDSDQSFADTALTKGWEGEGSAASPFIITRLEIDRGSGGGRCISISHTRVHFIIIDCVLIGGSAYQGAGIYLYNVTNGKIINNTCVYNYYGIYLYNSSFITISDNFCSYSPYSGVYLFSNCFNNTLTNNTCKNKEIGIHIFSSCSHNLLSDNTCTDNVHGIYIRNSNLNTVTNNNFSYNINRGIWMEYSSYNDIVLNNCSHNPSYGSHIYRSDYNTMLCNDYSFCSYGLVVRRSNDNSLLNNTCTNNNYGLYIHDMSYYNILANNTCRYSAVYGIYIEAAYYSSLTNNTCSDCNNGIFIVYGSYNSIEWNSLVNNTVNGYNRDSSNIFDYNYYSDYTGEDLDGDYIGDTPYSLPPYSYQDMHPLMLNPKAPPTWVIPPEDHVIEYEEIFTYDLNVTGYCDVDWWINNSVYFAISDDGTITKIAIIPLGSYPLLVQVTDAFGRVLSGVFTITVEDWSPPSWLELPVDQTLQCGTSLYCDLNASDVSDLDMWWINDTLRFSIDNQGILINNDIIPVGVYGIQVYVNDTLGYVLSYSFTVTVIDTITPSWVVEPENQIVEYGTPFVYELDATDPSGIGEWSVDDAARFSIDSTGRLTANALLPPDEYYLIIYVSDIHGNTKDALIIIEIRDTTAPEWVTEITDHYIDYGLDFEYHLTASDLSGIDYWQINDTLNFDISSNGWITSRDLLEPGEYGLLVTVYDGYRNAMQATFTVFVTVATTTTSTISTTTEETTTTTSTIATSSTSPTTSTSPTQPPRQDPMIVLVLSMSLGAGVAVVIVIIVLRKRGGSTG